MVWTTKDGRRILSGTHYTAFRHVIYDRCIGACELCTAGIRFEEMEVHHVKGRGLGGSKRDDVPEAVLGICVPCHRARHNQ